MMPIAIRATGLSKKYVIGHRRGGPYTTLRDEVSLGAKALVHRLVHPFAERRAGDGGTEYEEFWALRDLTFEVQQGDRIGIIGRNGAGKSTLLKILSRITEPSAGRVELKGRVTSLLEVGTGFHPELTGRENIFLNGAVLGMRRAEIAGKFDDIVAFAEVEKFLDTPIKRYSSGMYVRLAFAVAAHLDAEILIIDEVLAVGDRQFQEKCLGRIEDLSSGAGRTILLVSHNLDVIKRVCKRGLYLRHGTIAFDGSFENAADAYVVDMTGSVASSPLSMRTDRYGSQLLSASGFSVVDAQGARRDVLESGGDYTFVIDCRKNSSVEFLKDVNAGIEIRDSRNVTVWLAFSSFARHSFVVGNEHISIRCSVRDLNLAAGSYSVTLFFSHGEHDVLDCIHDAASLTVAGGDYFGTGSPGLPDQCKTLTRVEWQASNSSLS